MLLAAAPVLARSVKPLPRPVTIDLADGKLHYVRYGASKDEPLIVINGGPGFDHTHLLSSPTWTALAESRPVILYDQRGTGASNSLLPAERLTVAKLVDDLEQLRAALGASRFLLLGHSWGGQLAMAYAVRYPGHVRNLILVDSAAPLDSDTQSLFEQVYPDIAARRRDMRTRAKTTGKLDYDAYNRTYLNQIFWSPENRDRFVASLPKSIYAAEMAAAIARDKRAMDLRDALRALHLPTLLVTGRYDMNVAPIVAWQLAKLIPNATLRIFEKSGHMPFFEQPDLFVSTVELFLKSKLTSAPS
jgi:proline iminopeptidase